MEIRIELMSPEEVLEVLGSQDVHLRLLREAFPTVRVVARNGTLRLAGDDDSDLGVAERVVRTLLRRVRRSEHLNPDAVLEAIDAERSGETGRDLSRGAMAPGAAAAAASGATTAALRVRRYTARTAGQQRYLDLLDQNEIVFALGPAGTGKTFLAVVKAIDYLRRGDVSRIVLSRPAVEAGEKLGFLPGDFYAKVNPYLRPLYDALNDVLDPDTVRKLIEREIVEIVPLAYMRGRTLNRSFIILDEAQNTTTAQMKMFLTRMGEGSRIVVTGDETQRDLPPGKLSGLTHIRRILPDIPGIAFHRLTPQDIVRHALVWRIVEAYERAESGESPGGSPPAEP